MGIKDFFTPGFLLRGALIASLFVLCFISVVTYRQTLALDKSSELLVRSYQTQLKLEQFLSLLKDAETGQRGYIISKDTTFLEPYYNAQNSINKSFHTLRSLISGNLQQEKNLDTLNFLKNQRLMLLQKTLRMVSKAQQDSVFLSENLRQGKACMNIIREHVDKMIDLELVYKDERQEKYNREMVFTPLSDLLLVIFALLVLGLSFWKINKDLEFIKRSNQLLNLTTETIRHAEQIGGFGSLHWNLDTDKWTYSDNLFRILGCKPQSFEPSFEKFLEFVYPKDRQIFGTMQGDVRQGQELPVAYYRIIRNDGELRYFKFVSKIFVLRKGTRTLIATNQDVTDQHLVNASLEERNQELERSNKELASFNHVASHDLQEPLRKILTCISLIEEREIATISGKGVEYFSRIKASVSRMRVLIDDLLLYSRTNKAEKVFEKADLNELLESAEQDLMQSIEEKKATIYSAPLPALEVIPFQIKQLFTNLIANSLKYSKPGTPPNIEIGCEIVDAKSEPFLLNGKDQNYYRISIKDNGIGFEPQYAESIFTLFHRLHKSAEYPGTGIGLTICKKITENHSGYINALGEPGVGSTFNVYLPL